MALTREKEKERERGEKGIGRKLEMREDRELIVLQLLEQRLAPNIERGWACEKEPFVCK